MTAAIIQFPKRPKPVIRKAGPPPVLPDTVCHRIDFGIACAVTDYLLERLEALLPNRRRA